MPPTDHKITVFYDGACPRCVDDRFNYERLDSNEGDVIWFDITGKEEELKALGVDPKAALLELHIRDQNGEIRSELDAYQVLMARIPQYRLIGWLIGLPVIKPIAAALYHWMVKRRLKKEGRL